MTIFSDIIAWYMEHINYGTIILLMAVESSFIPFPSEIVIPPAAWKAAEGSLNLVLVIVCGVAGSIIGALFNYFFALLLGRKIIYSFARTRFAHAMLVDEKGVAKAEAYFVKYGNIATFLGRLVPAIRQLISLPAGLAKMPILSFLAFTALGSAIWSTVLALLGFFLFSQKHVLEEYYDALTIAGVVLAVLFIGYLVFRAVKNPRKSEPSVGQPAADGEEKQEKKAGE